MASGSCPAYLFWGFFFYHICPLFSLDQAGLTEIYLPLCVFLLLGSKAFTTLPGSLIFLK